MTIVEALNQAKVNFNQYTIVDITQPQIDKYFKLITVNLDTYTDFKLLYSDDLTIKNVRRIMSNNTPYFLKYLRQIELLIDSNAFETDEMIELNTGYQGFSISNQDGSFQKNTNNRSLRNKREIYDTFMKDFNDFIRQISDEIIDTCLVSYVSFV